MVIPVAGKLAGDGATGAIGAGVGVGAIDEGPAILIDLRDAALAGEFRVGVVLRPALAVDGAGAKADVFDLALSGGSADSAGCAGEIGGAGATGGIEIAGAGFAVGDALTGAGETLLGDDVTILDAGGGAGIGVGVGLA